MEQNLNLQTLLERANTLRRVQKDIQAESTTEIISCCLTAFDLMHNELNSEQKDNVRKHLLKLLDVIHVSYMQKLYWDAEDIVFEKDLDRHILSNFKYEVNE